jgi:hypothetical protein
MSWGNETDEDDEEDDKEEDEEEEEAGADASGVKQNGLLGSCASHRARAPGPMSKPQ